MKIKLWSINRWLRYTGLRLFVNVPDFPGDGFTSLELGWVGLPGSKGWRRWEGDAASKLDSTDEAT